MLDLSPQERIVIKKMSIGLDSGEIASTMGFSRQRFHQIKKLAFEKVLANVYAA